MNVAVRLIGKSSVRLMELLANSLDINLLYIVDADERKWNRKDMIYGMDVISPYTACRLLADGKIDKIILSPFLGERIVENVVNEMTEMGLDETNFCVPSIPDIFKAKFLSPEDIKRMTYESFATLEKMEIHLCDHCNMNCRNCSHFSSLVKEEVYTDPTEVESDLLQLAKYVKHIEIFNLLGGTTPAS